MAAGARRRARPLTAPRLPSAKLARTCYDGRVPLLIHSTVTDATSEIQRFVGQVFERMPFALVLPVTAVAPEQNAADPNCDWLTLPRCATPLQQRLLEVYARWFKPTASLFWRDTAASPTADFGETWLFDGSSWSGPRGVHSEPLSDERLLDALQACLPAILTSDTGVDSEQLRRALEGRPPEVRVYLRGALTPSVAESLEQAAHLAPGKIHLFLRLEQGVARPRSSLQWFRLRARKAPLRVTIHAQKTAADRACRAVFASRSVPGLMAEPAAASR